MAELPENTNGYSKNHLATIAHLPYSTLVYWIFNRHVDAPTCNYNGIKDLRYDRASLKVALQQIEDVRRRLAVIDSK